MNLHRLALLAAAGAAAGAAIATSAPAQTAHEAAVAITPSGAGAVKLGKTYQQLRAQHLIGRIRPGCNLGGPNTRSARLKAPLKGAVNFTLTTPRKVTDIGISGGATARGVGIGATIPDIRAAFPKARVDHSTDSTFGITLVKVSKRAGGPLRFAVDTKTKKVTLIGIPFIAFCE